MIMHGWELKVRERSRKNKRTKEKAERKSGNKEKTW